MKNLPAQSEEHKGRNRGMALLAPSLIFSSLPMIHMQATTNFHSKNKTKLKEYPLSQAILYR